MKHAPATAALERLEEFFAPRSSRAAILAREALTYFLDLPERLRGRRNRRLTLGGALAGRLRLSLMERQVPLWRSTPLRDLVLEDGRVTGAVLERGGRAFRGRGPLDTGLARPDRLRR